MKVSRLEFIRNAASTFGLGAFGVGRIFAAPPGWKPPCNPNLTLGVISDTHLRTNLKGDAPSESWPLTYLYAGLRLFRDENIDAVIHLGDFADMGQTRELQFHAEAWNSVFPGNLAPDGHTVEKLFVLGNHDIVGGHYGDFGGIARRLSLDPDQRLERLIIGDMAGNWERIWGEKYEPVWHKTLKGYHFFGWQWNVPEAEAARLVKENASELDGIRPFFLLSHVIPHKETCKDLRSFRNAVSFFGHWHASIADWRTVLFNGFPLIQCGACAPPGGYVTSAEGIGRVPLTGKGAAGRARYCFVVRLYDDMMAISRYEVGEGGKVGVDWVMPLGKYAPHPFSREEMRKTIGTPQFASGARLKVKNGPDSVMLFIPRADGNSTTRAYAYDIEVTGADRARPLVMSVYATGCNLAPGHEPNGGVTTLDIPKSELPSGKTLTFAVRPLTSLGTFGKAIETEFTA